MNTDLLLRVADAIEQHPDHFAMDLVIGTRIHGERVASTFRMPALYQLTFDDLRPGCGTTACIAGWVCYLETPDEAASTPNARELLGITEEQSDRLFYGTNYRAERPAIWEDLGGWDVTPDTVVTVLRQIAAGEVEL